MKALAMALCMLSLAAQPPATEEDALASVHELLRQGDQEGAVRELHDLVVRHPSSTELRALFVNLLSRREPERAYELARQLRYGHPDDPWSWYAVASVGLLEPSTKHLAEGLEALEKMTALAAANGRSATKPLPASMLRLKVMGMLRLGQVEEARAFLGTRDDAAALALLAMTHEEKALDDPAAAEKAEALYRRARAAAPDDLRIASAYAHFVQGRDPAAGTELARQLVAQAPLSLRAHERYWSSVVESRELTAQQKEAAITADADRLLAARDWPEILQALAGAYRRVESAKEEEINRRLLERFPWTPEAEYALFRIKLADRKRTTDPEVLAKRRQSMQEYLDYPVASPRRGSVYLMLMDMNRRDPSVSDAEFLRVIDGVRAYVDEPLYAKTNVAEALAERGLRLEEAERLARQGVLETPRMIDFERAVYGDDYQPTVDRLTAKARAALGVVLLKRNKPVEAGKELRAAAKVLPNDPELNLYLGRWHEQKKELSAAELAYGRGLIHEPAHSTKNLDALRALYERRKKTAEGFDVYVANLRQAGASDEKRRILAARIIPGKEVEQPFTLKDLAGKEVSLADMKGHVAVVNFWGLWCPPCVAELPDIQKLQQKYAADPGVRIVTINNDNDLGKVAKWMEKNGYSFPVLVDDGYVRKARVSAFPTTWFLDPDGKIAFEHKGGGANLVDEFSWRIEALKTVAR